MIGSNALWWSAAGSPLLPASQQRSCVTAMHPSTQPSYGGAVPVTHLLYPDGRSGQEVLQQQCQQSPYFASSMLDGLAVSNDKLLCEQGGYTSPTTKVPSLYPAIVSGTSEDFQVARLHGLSAAGQVPREDPLDSSVLHSQLNLKRKHTPHDLNHADTIPCKTRITDEKMAARLQGLRLSQQSASAECATTVAASASKPVPPCGAWDAQGWRKFHAVEQRLAATEEDSCVSFDRQEAPDYVQGITAEDRQHDCLRLELSPELHERLSITGLQSAELQFPKPQPSLALVLWTAPKQHLQGEAKQADESIGSTRPAGTEQAADAGHTAETEEKQEDEEFLVEPSEDACAGSTDLDMATLDPFDGTEQGPRGPRLPCDNDSVMEI